MVLAVLAVSTSKISKALFFFLNEKLRKVTSIVLPLLAVRISPGRKASADTMFSHDAIIKNKK